MPVSKSVPGGRSAQALREWATAIPPVRFVCGTESTAALPSVAGPQEPLEMAIKAADFVGSGQNLLG